MPPKSLPAPVQAPHKLLNLPQSHAALDWHVVLQHDLPVVILLLSEAQLADLPSEEGLLLEAQLLGEVVVAGLVDLLVGSALVVPVGLLDLVEVLAELH